VTQQLGSRPGIVRNEENLMNDSASASAVRNAAAGGGLSGLPSFLVAALVIAGAVYSFSPRKPPVFMETQVYADRLLVNSVARNNGRLVAVGEQGQILLADDAQGPWRSAAVEPQRGSTFTSVRFADKRVAVAVGHDGWIVRSSDGGETWSEVAFNESGSDPLLGIAGPYNGRLFAYGAFGMYLVSDDLGQTWNERSISAASAGQEADVFAESDDPYADPFAAFQAQEFSGERHVNGITRAADGALIAVGERGLLQRSTDNGESWTELPEIYSGSLFGVVLLPSKTLVTYGMRGNAFRSEDHGQTWTRSELPTSVSMFAGSVDAQGQVLLAGAGSLVLRSIDDGRSFKQQTVSARDSIAELLPLPGDAWLTAGEGGLRITRPSATTANGERS
jgi:photosystem II stability/assembly factor-like uncharacterized protein